MFKKKLGFLLGVMLLLSVAGYAVCSMTGAKELSEKKISLVTSFYPMYVLTQNLAVELEGISVVNLTENQTGCLHDYQLTTKDMRLLTDAGAFIINGAGMELFMEKVIDQREELTVIDASKGIALLEGVAHDHSHEEQETEMPETHEHAENGHVWMAPELYLQQMEAVAAGLKGLFPEQKEAVDHALGVYRTQVQEIAAEYEQLRESTEGAYAVIFHEGFAYLADSLGMEVLRTFSLDEETTPGAGEIAETIEEIRHHGSAVIFIEEAYGSHAEKIVAETGAAVVYLDPLTTGDGALRSYLDGMEQNLKAIRAAFIN